MLRSLIVVHRYVGVVLGVLMTLWCLSGFVMMYQGFPALTPAERLAGLEPLPADCCDLSRIAIDDAAAVSEARVEMAAGAPILKLRLKDQPPAVFDLLSGEARRRFSEPQILSIARTFGVSRDVRSAPHDLGVIDVDQWSVELAKRNRPVHHIAFNDPAGTEIYVSGRTGEVFLDTDRKERVLSWFGAIPHWLYPTILRQDAKAWSQVVIWTSTVGVFLTITGLYVGIARIGALGRFSPYKGLWFWHHLTGLVFGVLTLTWVASGLLTMNPWGLFESQGRSARAEIAGALTWGQVKAAFARPELGGVRAVELAAAPLGGRAYLTATDGAGHVRRLDGAGQPSPVLKEEVSDALATAGLKVASLDLLRGEEAYYYGHHSTVKLPAWRAILADGQRTRVYVDAASGRVARIVDRPARQERWFSSALHDFDWLHARPLWDLVVLPLLAGVTAVCASGAWLGIERIGKDVRALRKGLSRRARSRSMGAGERA